MIPGGGAVISSFASYALEKKLSRSSVRFGEGAIEGVAGPESANNAASSGTFVPLLTLGIPTNAPMALFFGAFMIHGVVPGPFILQDHPQVFWGIVTSMYIGNIILLILNIPLIRVFVKILDVPLTFLSPLIVVVCVIGAFSMNNNPADVLIMIAFGGLGYLMKKFDYEPAPFMLACVLGPLLEKSIRQSLIISQGSLSIFVNRPISRILVGLLVLLILLPIFKVFLKRWRSIPRGR
jgi:putative tricarboxylic transport membrane protein